MRSAAAASLSLNESSANEVTETLIKAQRRLLSPTLMSIHSFFMSHPQMKAAVNVTYCSNLWKSALLPQYRCVRLLIAPNVS